MKEALGFQGKDFNYIKTVYLVTYAVCQMPGTSMLTIDRPKYVFVAGNVTWSVLTLITYKTTRAWQLLNGMQSRPSPSLSSHSYYHFDSFFHVVSQ